MTSKLPDSHEQEIRAITDKRIFEARDIVRNAPDDGKQYSLLMNTAVELADDIQSLIVQQITAAEKRGYSRGYAAMRNDSFHDHNWVISDDQSETGTIGVRKKCSRCGDTLTFLDKKLHDELQAKMTETGK